MTWSAEETDELLIRYLDRELSSEELKRFEQLILTDSTLRQKLMEWKALERVLKNYAFQWQDNAVWGMGLPTELSRQLKRGFEIKMSQDWRHGYWDVNRR